MTTFYAQEYSNRRNRLKKLGKEEEEKSIPEKSLLEIFKQVGSETSLHGIPNVLRSELIFMKILWALAFAGMLGFCLYQVYQSFSNYLAFDVLTKNTIVNEPNALFPSVVICNQNAFNGYFDRKQIEDILVQNGLSSDNVTSFEEEERISNLFKAEFRKIKITDPETTFGFFLDEMLINCTFQGKNCFKEDFEEFYDYNYGNCYKFNGGTDGKDIRRSKESKYSAGLSLELFIGEPLYQQQFTYKSGIRLVVHNQSFLPFPDDDGIDIATGQETNVAVGRTFITRAGDPYSPCLGDTTDEDFPTYSETVQKMITLYNITKYYTKACLKVCLQELIFDGCNCYDLKLPLPGYSNETSFFAENGCFSQDQFECIKQKENAYYERDIEGCIDNCPLACEQIYYTTNTNFAAYPSVWYAKVLNKDYSFKKRFVKDSELDPNYTVPFATIQETCLRINVYYGQTYYNSVEESAAKTFENLITDLAGNLGLTIGVDALTFAEIPELIFFLVYNLIGRIFL